MRGARAEECLVLYSRNPKKNRYCRKLHPAHPTHHPAHPTRPPRRLSGLRDRPRPPAARDASKVRRPPGPNPTNRVHDAGSRLHLARLRRPRLASCFSSRGSPCATRSPIRCRHGDDAKRGHLDVGDEGSSRSAPGSRFAGAVTLLSCASDKDSRSSSLTPKDAGSTCGEEAAEEA